MRIENLTQAKEDLFDGYLFYERLLLRLKRSGR